MVLQSYFTDAEIDMIINALTAQETKWHALAKKGIQGDGRATELANKDRQKAIADSYTELLNKIVEYTI